MVGAVSSLVSVAALVVLGAGGPALEAIHDHCRADRDRFCRKAPDGWNGSYRCLQEHQARLSAACKRQVAETAQVHADCQADVAKLCADIYPAGGLVFECLRASLDELSQQCRLDVKAAYKAVAETSAACEEELARYCRHVKAAERALECLEAQQDKLSKPCRTALRRE